MGSGVSKNEALGNIHVLIIGGGYAGVQAAAELLKVGVAFTLVDPKEYFHHCVGALRAAVNPEYASKTAIPFREAFGDSFVQGSVVSLDLENHKAMLEGGREIAWTHCLVAVGSLGPVPGRSQQLTMEGLEQEAKMMAENIEKAEKVVIIGGGPVGFELAGEIFDKYKQEKKVTIVSASDKLVSNDFSEKFNASVKYLWESAGVEVVVGKADLTTVKVNMVEKQSLHLGEVELEADLVISCIGMPPNKAEVAKLLPATSIDENGRVKVDEYLAVEGCSNVFALGDCCNTAEHKMAAHAAVHGETVVANILLEAGGKSQKAYKQKFVGMLVPFGASAGAGSFNGWNLPNFAVVMLKSGDLFTSKYWATMGQKEKMPKL